MKIRFQLISVTCLAPLKSDRDALKIHLIAASDSGDVAKLESNSEPSISGSLDVGPYELQANDTLELYGHPPAGRLDWMTEPLAFGELSRIRMDLLGIGLHKAELGGGADPDSPVAKVLTTLRDELVGLIPYVGKVVVKLLQLAEKFATADPNKNCLGPVFAFNRELQGSDLIINLIKSNYSGEIRFTAGESVVNTSSECRKPQYQTFVRMHLVGNIRFDSQNSSRFISKGPEATLTDVLAECRQKDAIKVWVSRRESTFEVTPTTQFTSLKYGWNVQGVELREGEGSFSASTSVSRINISQPNTDPAPIQQSVNIVYKVEPNGKLILRCAETTGNYELSVTCHLRNDHNEVRVHQAKLNVESEVLDGNDAYKAYLNCVRVRALKHIQGLLDIKQLILTIPTSPQPLESVKGLEELGKIAITVKTLTSQLETLKKIPSFKGPGF